MPTKIFASVKMFKVGELGDCFLLRFRQGNRKSHVLIDCGSFRNSGKSKDRMIAIATEIKEILGDDKLDAVVGTHQHNDHYSGFYHAREVFASIEVDQVWLSWLDDPTDPLAQKIIEQHHNLRLTLLETVDILQSLRGAGAEKLVADLKSFVDLEDGAPAFAARKGKSTTDLALDVLKGLGTPRYLSPGAILDLPGIYSGGVKVYVLGPPRNYKQIRDTRPGSGESYDKHLADLQFHARAFLDTLKGGGQLREERNYPFNSTFEVRDREFAERFPELRRSYEDRTWQRIDEDWLRMGEQLALHLNSYTNNTSLVLAFELVYNEKVLLFVGDAQTGNWLSWPELLWSDSEDHLPRLLEQTVLYKVGHHGSHNATLPAIFEQMTHPELTALIPVDDSDPNITKDYHPWRMPAAHLYERVIEKTRGRVLRMDHGPIPHPENNWPAEPWEGELFWEVELE